MKKILIVALLMVTCSNVFAFLKQGNWRWRKDDGSETSATWLAALNTAPAISSSTDIIRLRYEALSPLTTSTTLDDTLQWGLSPTGPWTNLELASASAPFIIAGSAFVTHGELTTSQLALSLNYPWYPGKIMADSTPLKWTLPSKYRTEYEWCIQPTPNVQTNTTYYFRNWGAIAELQNGKTYPQLKTAAVLPICFASVSVSAEGKKTKVEWVTSCEKNNSYFDVERSNDGANWTKVTSVKATSNSTAAVTYTAYDNSPLNGTNFYRIKQYDIDGKSSVSVVRSLKMYIETASLLNVYPNPVREKINFSLQQLNAQNAQITLHNISGKLIHAESLKTVSSNTTYTLQMKSRPAPGVYILTLKATGVAQSIRVVVE